MPDWLLVLLAVFGGVVAGLLVGGLIVFGFFAKILEGMFRR